MAVAGPRLRRDLVTRRTRTGAEAHVEVSDPRTRTRYRFYDFEFAMAQSLDGRPLDQVLPIARSRSGVDLNLGQLVSFVERLAELDFLEPAPPLRRPTSVWEPTGETPAIPPPLPPPSPSGGTAPVSQGGGAGSFAPLSRIPPSGFAALGIIAAAVIGFVAFRILSVPRKVLPTVSTMVPAPASIHRWFAATTTVKLGGDRALSFTTSGKIVKVLPPEAGFAPGELVAELEGAKKFRAELDKNKDKLAALEEQVESLRGGPGKAATQRAESKLAALQKQLATAQAGLARNTITAPIAGSVAEVLATVGAQVRSGAPVVRTRATEWRAELELPRKEAERLRRLGFCHAEVDGQPVGCAVSPDDGDETHVLLELPRDPAVALGKTVRVARARYDDVYVLPAAAILPSKGPDRRVFVVEGGRAEIYAVVLADQSATDAVVTQGLEPGLPVILNAPTQLRPREEVQVVAGAK